MDPYSPPLCPYKKRRHTLREDACADGGRDWPFGEEGGSTRFLPARTFGDDKGTRMVAWQGAILLPPGHFGSCVCLEKAEEGLQGMRGPEDTELDLCFPLQAQMTKHASPECG